MFLFVAALNFFVFLPGLHGLLHQMARFLTHMNIQVENYRSIQVLKFFIIKSSSIYNIDILKSLPVLKTLLQDLD